MHTRFEALWVPAAGEGVSAGVAASEGVAAQAGVASAGEGAVPTQYRETEVSQVVPDLDRQDQKRPISFQVVPNLDRQEQSGVQSSKIESVSRSNPPGEAECRTLAERIEAEVRRLEAVFNRHDPASPVAALNRCRPVTGSGTVAGPTADSNGNPVATGRAADSGRVRARVADDDLWFLLEIGEQFRKATFGYFDLAALSNHEALLQAGSPATAPFSAGNSPAASGADSVANAFPGAKGTVAMSSNGFPGAEEDSPAATGFPGAEEAPFRLLHATHEIELRRGCILDFGGIAKGYALEKVRNILSSAGVENALLNFGGSSVLGMGHHPLGPCWEVAPEGPPPSEPSLETPQFRDGNPEITPPSLETAQNRDRAPEITEPSLNTPQFRDRAPETAEPSLNTPQFRDRAPETAEPSQITADFRNGSPLFRLRDSALSISGRDREGREHVVDPHTGRPARHPAAAPAGSPLHSQSSRDHHTRRIAHPADDAILPDTGTITPSLSGLSAITPPPTGHGASLAPPADDAILPDTDTITPPTTGLGAIPPQTSHIAVTGRSALVCEILSTALYAAPKELQNEIIANFEGYTQLTP